MNGAAIFISDVFARCMMHRLVRGKPAFVGVQPRLVRDVLLDDLLDRPLIGNGNMEGLRSSRLCLPSAGCVLHSSARGRIEPEQPDLSAQVTKLGRASQ
jgi:hypothetical protein